MPKSASQTVITIPELVALISAHLTSRDIIPCVFVCKDWRRQFEPVLWANFTLCKPFTVSLNDTPLTPLTAALLRNLPHIRTINIDTVVDTQLQVIVHGLPPQDSDAVNAQSPCCVKLRQFGFESFNSEYQGSISLHLVTLLHHNLYLTHLNIPLFNDEMLDAISTLAQLQRLTIHSGTGNASTRDTLLLLQACLPLPQLTHLHIVMDVDWGDGDDHKDMPDLETVLQEATRKRFTDNPTATKIISLRLPTNRFGDRYPLPLLILKFSLLDLEACEIPWFHEDTSRDEIQQIVQKHCPNLTRLICPSFKDCEEHTADLAAKFVVVIPALKSFESENFSDYDEDFPDPEYFTEDETSSEPRCLFPQVLLRHESTLEILELRKTRQVFSHDQQYALANCRQLQRFWVMGNHTADSCVGIKAADVCDNDWGCWDLKELGLTINRFMADEYPQGGSDDEEEVVGDDGGPFHWLTTYATKRLYRQIGELDKLELLGLDIETRSGSITHRDHWGDLTIFKGWLMELYALKNLKTLELYADLWTMMGHIEVDFMNEFWPSLIEIGFCVDDISKIREQPHWQWFLNKRPQLRLKRVYL
ncbi:hypothetical protein EC968_005182 [Mortierella alpina]|nr:hypothetical protein EC968_005182 [Mortierella alpina]